jgi:hypothetical protein
MLIFTEEAFAESIIAHYDVVESNVSALRTVFRTLSFGCVINSVEMLRGVFMESISENSLISAILPHLRVRSKRFSQVISHLRSSYAHWMRAQPDPFPDDLAFSRAFIFQEQRERDRRAQLEKQQQQLNQTSLREKLATFDEFPTFWDVDSDSTQMPELSELERRLEKAICTPAIDLAPECTERIRRHFRSLANKTVN